MVDEQRGVVLYTDGSARPTNPGFTGWGVHGYLYEVKELPKPFIIEDNIITNKGYLLQRRMGDAVAVEPLNYFDFLGSSSIRGSNDLAEMKAFYYSLKHVFDLNTKFIHVITDSKYVQNGSLNWCKNWAKNGWRKQDGNPIENRDYWENIYTLILAIEERGSQLTVDWVKGHKDDLGNTIADILAATAANYSIHGHVVTDYNVSDVKGYWKHEIERHPFISCKRIFFNSVPQFNVPGHYFQTDPGSDLVIGKRIPEAGFSVIKLKDHDPVIEAVKAKQYEVANNLNAIIMMKLDRVYSREVYPYLNTHGKYCLQNSRNNLNVLFVDKKPVTIEMNPTGLSMRALESFNLLEELLSQFIESKNPEFRPSVTNTPIVSHDLTGVFFDKEEKLVKKETIVKHTLKPEFIVGFKDLVVDVNEEYNGNQVKVKIPLILGTDLLARNGLKKLEDQNPKVFLITWRESLNSLRYATVIECDSGIGIWSNFFADKIFFT